MKVDLSCPIELWEYELPTEEKPVCSFTFFNLGQRTISSIQITITLFDEQDEIISRRVERPMALDATGREPFVVEIPSEGLPIEAVDLSIDKAWFEDGSEWRRQQDVRLVEYEPNELPPNRQLEQLRYIAGHDAVGFPSDQGEVWICICGRVNAAEERQCRRCDRDKEDVFAFYSRDAVQHAIDAREKELEDKARMAREEASRQEFMRQDKVRRKKRARRTRTIIITSVLVVAVLSYLFIVLGLPELKYQTAVSALAAGEISTARASFEELLDYRDAAEMVSECDLRLASEYALSRDMTKVERAVEMLTELGSYPGAAEMANEARYQQALLYMEGKDYEKASALFSELTSYRDAVDKRNEADYQRATLLMNAANYGEAAKQFTALGLYMDAAALARECVYRPAMQKKADGDYKEAADMFATIAGYKDANDQRLQSIYQDALRAQLANDPEYAAEQFALLGDYEDSPEQVKRSIYLAANSARDLGKYDMAIKLYTTVSEYEDAAEQIKACTYLPAKALMTDGQYAEAAEMFAEIPGYEDADELYNQSIYMPAMDAIEAEDYEAAVELLAKIPNYSDVKKLLPQTEYKLAERLEEKGVYEAAIEAFDALGDYSDAADRAKAARYALAETLFAAGNFEGAAEEFEALGKYSDARTRVKECAYEKALLLIKGKDTEAAYEALAAIEDYDPAKEKAREIAYQMGEERADEGDLAGAAEAFALAGRYEDAETRRQESIYKQAKKLKEEGSYQEAGKLFDTITGYTDARTQRDESNDLWLAEIAEEATVLHKDGEFQAVIDLLKPLDMEALPKAYANIETMYRDSNLKIARQLIADDKALDAYIYLMAADGYRNANELLNKNIYRILGTWETEEGARYAFFLNGTASIAGETVYFNMFNPYGISTGKTADPADMARTLSYSTASDKVLQLREDASGKVLKLTRVKGPELSQTNDSEGTVVMSEAEKEHLEDPVVDTITVGEDADPFAEKEKDTPEDTGEEVEEEPTHG